MPSPTPHRMSRKRDDLRARKGKARRSTLRANPWRTNPPNVRAVTHKSDVWKIA